MCPGRHATLLSKRISVALSLNTRERFPGPNMLTKLTIRNFKRFDDAEIELGNPIVFIGPNNSGKTSAMQALTLWDIGVKRWNEKRPKEEDVPKKRPGVALNRRDLLSIPHPSAIQLWRGLQVRASRKGASNKGVENVRIDIIVDGVTKDKEWTCGIEFDYANEESFYCRPLRRDPNDSSDRMPVPEELKSVQVALLPSMSGLAAMETRLDQGAVNVRVGEGRTAEVLRNLCYRISEHAPDKWEALSEQIEELFGAKLDKPQYVEERGEITMGYTERDVRLDLSSSGRGLQQTLLILAYMHANPGSVMLLDEPDAHLEILRQRQIYRLITEAAAVGGNQIIAASHSEVLLNEAAGKDAVIAFVGRPHRIANKSQVQKALASIGFEQYYQAEQTGWVLYLEGPTDLAILQSFAKRLGHEEAIKALERAFVHYVCNQQSRAEAHYYGLREALPDLAGLMLLDDIKEGEASAGPLKLLCWSKREIENYLCTQATLEAYARESASAEPPLPLLTESEAEARLEAMRNAIAEVAEAMHKLRKGSPWSDDVKVSDEFLGPLFEVYFSKLGRGNPMQKTHFHKLARHVPEDEIDPEVAQKLDAIAEVAAHAARHET